MIPTARPARQKQNMKLRCYSGCNIAIGKEVEPPPIDFWPTTLYYDTCYQTAAEGPARSRRQQNPNKSRRVLFRPFKPRMSIMPGTK